MRLFVFLLMVGAAGFFAWKYQESEQAKAAVEARLTEVTQTIVGEIRSFQGSRIGRVGWTQGGFLDAKRPWAG